MSTLEKHILPNGTEVTFCPESHKYYVDGQEVPSVTTIIQEYYGNMYAAVRPEILEAAAKYGTNVHKDLNDLIELRSKNEGIPLISDYVEVNNYFEFVEPIYDIKPVMAERVIVIYDDFGKPIAAGRFDLLCTVKGKLTLADFKTTSTIHRQSVSAQLNLYLKGAVQSGYIEDGSEVDLGVIHLSGSTSKYVPITKFGPGFFEKILAKYQINIDF